MNGLVYDHDRRDMIKLKTVFLLCIWIVLFSSVSFGSYHAPYWNSQLQPFAVELPAGKRIGLLNPDSRQWVITPEYINVQQKGAFFIATLEDGSLTLLDVRSGNSLFTPQKFDEIGFVESSFHLNHGVSFRQGNRWGFFRVAGEVGKSAPVEIIYPPQFLSIFHETSTWAEVEYEKGKWKAIALTDQYPERHTPEGMYFTEMKMLDYQSLVKSPQGKWGVLFAGSLFIPCDYDQIYFEKESRRYIGKKVDSKGLTQLDFYKDTKKIINSITGLESFHYQIDQDEFMVHSVGKAKKNDKWGLLNSEGKWLLSPQYEDILPSYYGVSNGFIPAQKNNLWGGIDLKGNWILDPVYQDAKAMDFYAVPYKQNGKWGAVDWHGHYKRISPFVPFDFENIGEKIGDNAMAAKWQGKWGVYESKTYPEKKEGWIVQPEYDEILKNGNSSHYLQLRKADQWYIFSYYALLDAYSYRYSKAKAISPQSYQTVEKFAHLFGYSDAEETAKVQQNNKWGYINYDFSWRISPVFDEIDPFRHSGANVTGGNSRVVGEQSFALARQGNSWGVIDSFGKWRIKPEFDSKPEVSTYLGFIPGKKAIVEDDYWGTPQKYIEPVPDQMIYRVNDYFYGQNGGLLDCYPNSIKKGEQALIAGNWKEAKGYFEKALKFIPDDQAAQYGLKKASVSKK